MDDEALKKRIAEIEKQTLEILKSARPDPAALDDPTLAMIRDVNAVVEAERRLGPGATDQHLADATGLPVQRVREIRRTGGS